jgi:TonB-linked SusC/RagA family outer membrane protein
MSMKKVLKTLFFTYLVFALSLSAAAQQEVKGVVTDETGEPLPGVTVIIVDSNKGVITDINGNYSLQVETGATLQFSFIGMVSQQVKVGSNLTIDISLQTDAIGLEEIQVVGYGVQKKVTVTGAIANIGNEELIKSPSASVTNALAGRITGIAAVQNTGQPGADEASLYIRGVATLNDASPLTIVDGVERPFSQIDPEEIESIAVLKDASATAVYGVRGANGVIIVTTKRGQKGKTKISVSTSMGVQQPTMMLDKANSYKYALGHNERNINDGNPASTNVFTDEVLDIFKGGGNILFPDTDWFDYLFKENAIQTKTNFTLSGGTDKIRYFTALGYLSQEGQLEDLDPRFDGNFKYNRYNYRSNVDIDVTPTTLLKVTIGGRTEIRNQPEENQMWKEANWAQPFAGSGIVDGKWVSTSQDNVNIEMKDPLRGFYGKGFNNNTKTFLDFDLDVVQQLDFVTKGLSARVKGSYNTDYTHTKTRTSSPDRYESIYMPGDSTQVVYRKVGDEGKMNYSEWTGKARNWYMEAALNYNRKFGKHEVGALALYNQRVLYYPGGTYNDIPRRTLGLVGRITYNYMTKYLLDLNVGYNGSENFPEAKRYGLFPAVSAGWVVSEESFMEDLGFIDYMKIRGSYGLVGNDRLGSNRFLYLPDSWDYSTGGYNFGYDNPNDQQGATELRIGNPNVTWETATKQNYGVDMKFFDAKLGISFDYFHEYREDILIARNTVPVYVAAELPVVNMGEVENQGYEVEVKWNQNVGRDFTYRISANMSYAHNEIIFKDEIPQPFDYLYETGNAVGQPFGYVTNGFFTEEINTIDNADYPDHQGIRYPGDLMYQDLSGDGKIDDLDRMPVGYSERVPEYNYGVNTYFNWKGLDLSVVFAGVKNTSRTLPSYFREPYAGQNRGLFSHLYDGRWTPETAETAEFPRFSKNSAGNNYRVSDLYIRDASYLRLKNIELGYSIKSPGLKRIGLRNVRIFANGYNLVTWSNFTYFDPESRVGSGGLYPMTKVYNMGLKFNF